MLNQSLKPNRLFLLDCQIWCALALHDTILRPGASPVKYFNPFVISIKAQRPHGWSSAIAEKKNNNSYLLTAHGGTCAQVMMNGRPLGVQFKRNSAYVAQEDCFVPTMSAWETLKFTATLTLPKAISPEDRRVRIEEVLKIMGLWRSRDTQASDSLF